MDISVNMIDPAVEQRTTSFQRGYSRMITARTLWEQTYGVTSFECLQGSSELDYIPRAYSYLHEIFHYLGVVNVSFRKVLHSLYRDSPSRLNQPAGERLAPKLGGLCSEAQHIARLVDSAQRGNIGMVVHDYPGGNSGDKDTMTIGMRCEWITW